MKVSKEVKRDIKVLISASFNTPCRDLHHDKKDNHSIHDECPVEVRVQAAITRLTSVLPYI